MKMSQCLVKFIWIWLAFGIRCKHINGRDDQQAYLLPSSVGAPAGSFSQCWSRLFSVRGISWEEQLQACLELHPFISKGCIFLWYLTILFCVHLTSPTLLPCFLLFMNVFIVTFRNALKLVFSNSKHFYKVDRHVSWVSDIRCVHNRWCSSVPPSMWTDIHKHV